MGLAKYRGGNSWRDGIFLGKILGGTGRLYFFSKAGRGGCIFFSEAGRDGVVVFFQRRDRAVVFFVRAGTGVFF